MNIDTLHKSLLVINNLKDAEKVTHPLLRDYKLFKREKESFQWCVCVVACVRTHTHREEQMVN